MSFADTAVLFVLALLLFGPKKLPGIARQIGKALNEFKRASNEFKAQIEAEITNLDVQSAQAEIEKAKRSILSHVDPPAAPEGTVASGATEHQVPAIPESSPHEASEVNSVIKAPDA